jgi:hypothetical protein
MSLSSNVNNLAVRVATEAKALRTLLNGNAADLSGLNTVATSNLVAAINEIEAAVSSASGIDDATTSTTTTWSSSKINTQITSAVSDKAVIDDASTSTSKVWSSSKTNTAINSAVADKPVIDDASTSTSKVWSSSKTNTAINSAVANKAVIDDDAASTTTVYSSSKTDSQIGAAIDGLVDGAGAALDTLRELAAALGDDPNFATTISGELANRVRFDAAQTLTGPQQTQARANIDAASATGVGDTTTNLVTTFEAGLA